MRILKKLLIAVAAVILVVALAIAVSGFRVPAERSFTNEIDINAPELFDLAKSAKDREQKI